MIDFTKEPNLQDIIPKDWNAYEWAVMFVSGDGTFDLTVKNGLKDYVINSCKIKDGKIDFSKSKWVLLNGNEEVLEDKKKMLMEALNRVSLLISNDVQKILKNKRGFLDRQIEMELKKMDNFNANVRKPF